ncbi:MAG: MFS transporter [Gammaproteobacteria bacterium]|nr:MFS transporter [Gammaproteobacteria bacterium]MBT5201989.1 MFS transporter [Gammaproteobacteria bacterium]MBT5603644.1 MFS transporter [Gammaproteobacteria bacterium]MBT6246459.1 MFS transporter [Gammaproteobacteria bacterium]
MSATDPVSLQGGSSAYPAAVPSKVKFVYGIGAAAEAIIGVAFNAFNFFFYTNIMGVPGTLAGLAITIALVVDAITDPLVGTLSDRWRSRLGRRHPFMFAAPIPVMLCLFLIYTPPADFSSFGLFLWLTGLTVVMRSAMTLFHVPHLALGAELSADFTERTRVMSINTLLGSLGGFGTAFIAYSFVFSATPEYANGLMNRDAYPAFAIWASCAGGLVMVVSTVLTLDLVPKLPQVPVDFPRLTTREFIRDVQSAMSNRNYLMLLIGYLLLSASLGTRDTIGLHMNTYYWELLPEQIRYFMVFGLIAPIIGFIVVAPLHNRFEKKPVLITGLVLLLVFATSPVMLRISGYFPENSSELLIPLLMVFYLLTLTFGVILLISAMSALADIADEHELNTYRRQEGIFYAARSFFAKASSGLGHLLAGIAIDVIDFPVGAEPGTVDPDTIFRLGLIDGPIALVPGVIAVFFYLRYNLTRERHADIQAQLQARNGR